MKKLNLFPSLLILFIGFLGFLSCKQDVPVVLSSEKSIISYSVLIGDESYEGIIDNKKREITISDVPYNCDVTSLRTLFIISEKAKISIDGQYQTSGESFINFTESVIYLVTAEDGSKVEWTVKLIKKVRPVYTVTFHKNFPESQETDDIIKEYAENESIVLPVLESTDEYKFLGWSKFANSENVDYEGDANYVVINNIELWGVWKKNTARYTINVFKQTFDDSYFDKPDYIFVTNGVIGSKIEYDVSSYIGFTLDSNKYTEVFIGADGLSVLNVYLKRNIISYKVNFYKETLSGTYSDTADEVKNMSGKFEAVAEYDISSYPGFSLDEDRTESAKISADGSTSVNVYLKRKIISYKVNIYKESLEGSYSDIPDEVKTLSGKFEAAAEYDVSSYSEFFINEDKTESGNISADGSTSINVYLKRKTASYIVKYFKEKTNGTYAVTADDVVTVSGKAGAKVVFESNKYVGFEIDSGKTTSSNEKIKEDNSTVVNVYYKRLRITVKLYSYFADLEGNYPETPEETFSTNTVYDENYTIEAPLVNGFVSTKESISISNAECSDNVYSFIFYYDRKQINYLVKHLVEDANSNSYKLDTSETKSGLYGSEMTYQAKDFGDYISFDKVEYSSANKTISENSYVNVYYKRSSISFTYKWNIAGKADTVKTFKYGQSVTSPSVEERILYSFVGWTPSVPSTATANKTFEAQWNSLAGTTSSYGPTFIKNFPETIFVKKPVLESRVFLSAYVDAKNTVSTSYTLYKSYDGINWLETGTTHQLSTSSNYQPLSLPITIAQDNGDVYYCMAVSESSIGVRSYSNVCRIITNPEETENIGSYYYSDGTYSIELAADKTVVGIVASLKEDKSPKMIIPVAFTTSSGDFTAAKQSCESYSADGISDWKLPDFIELESVLFNTSVINTSLQSINSSLSIQTYTYNKPVFYWAEKENGINSNLSLTLYLYRSLEKVDGDTYEQEYYYSMTEKNATSTSMKGYYLPVKVLE